MHVWMCGCIDVQMHGCMDVKMYVSLEIVSTKLDSTHQQSKNEVAKHKAPETQGTTASLPAALARSRERSRQHLACVYGSLNSSPQHAFLGNRTRHVYTYVSTKFAGCSTFLLDIVGRGCIRTVRLLLDIDAVNTVVETAALSAV